MENEISNWFQNAVGSQMVWTVKGISSSGGFKSLGVTVLSYNCKHISQEILDWEKTDSYDTTALR